MPYTITAEGWYTFEHRFRDNGFGVLAVDLTIKNAAGVPLMTWTLSDPTDVIGPSPFNFCFSPSTANPRALYVLR